MAVKSYQAQGEGEISLSKGEKIKGDRAWLGGYRVKGISRWGPKRALRGPSGLEEREALYGTVSGGRD